LCEGNKTVYESKSVARMM